MKWYLITAHHTNPGDQFARLGVERLINRVDPEATFYRVNKHTAAIHTPVECDRIVVCGMPLAWSRDVDATWREHWWGAFNGWMADYPMILAGVGSFASYPEPKFTFLERLKEEMAKLFAHCKAVYCRDSLFAETFGVPIHPCPSIFSIMDMERTNELNFCNFMPDGAHYEAYNPKEARIWKEIRGELARELQAQDFEFVAHNEAERELAEQLNFQTIHTYGDFPETLLSVYSRCAKYFGNRVHGGIVAAANGAFTRVCGYDSRMYSLVPVGGRFSVPSNTGLGYWVVGDKYPLDLQAEFEKQLQYFQ